MCTISKEDGESLPCAHSFHKHCISQWRAQSNLCPVCRTPHQQNSHPHTPTMQPSSYPPNDFPFTPNEAGAFDSLHSIQDGDDHPSHCRCHFCRQHPNLSRPYGGTVIFRGRLARPPTVQNTTLGYVANREVRVWVAVRIWNRVNRGFLWEPTPQPKA